MYTFLLFKISEIVVTSCSSYRKLTQGVQAGHCAPLVRVSPKESENQKRRSWTSLAVQGLSIHLPRQKALVHSLVGELRSHMPCGMAKRLKQNRDETYLKGFPGGTVDKNPPANAGDTGLIPGPGRSHELHSS